MDAESDVEEETAAMESGDDISDSELQAAEGKHDDQKKEEKKEDDPKKSKKECKDSEKKALKSQTRVYLLASSLIAVFLFAYFLWILLAISSSPGTPWELRSVWRQVADSQRVLNNVLEVFIHQEDSDMAFDLDLELIKETLDELHQNLSLAFSNIKFGTSYQMSGLIGRNEDIDHHLFESLCFDWRGPITCREDQQTLAYFGASGLDDVVSMFLDHIGAIAPELAIDDNRILKIFEIYETSLRPGFVALSNLLVDDLLNSFSNLSLISGAGVFLALFSILLVKVLLLNKLISALEKESQDAIQLLSTIPEEIVNAVPAVKNLISLQEELSELDVESLLNDAQAKNNSILGLVKDAIITANDEGVIESFNASAEKVFGWKASEVIGENVTLLMPAHHGKIHHQYMESYLVTGNKKVIGSGRLVPAVHKEGHQFPAHLDLSEMNLSGRRAFCAVIQDFTDRVNMQTKLNHVEGLSSQMMTTTRDLLIAVNNDSNKIHSISSVLIKHLSIDQSELINAEYSKFFVLDSLEKGESLYDHLSNLEDVKVKVGFRVFEFGIVVSKMVKNCDVFLVKLLSSDEIDVAEDFQKPKNLGFTNSVLQFTDDQRYVDSGSD
ncbi:hypothetical protein GEMRC1_010976 [Eukaryota sp. GEM-RC1]